MSKLDVKYKIYRLKEKLMYKVIKLTPAKLKYFIAIDVMAYATCGKYGNTNVADLTVTEAIKRYGKDKGLDNEYLMEQ